MRRHPADGKRCRPLPKIRGERRERLGHGPVRRIGVTGLVQRVGGEARALRARAAGVLPVNKPPASGPYGTTARPNA
jgi:hypothetical protein